MPTSEPYSPGEIQRTLARIEQTMGSLAGSVVTKDELKLHMDGLRTQFKVIDDRHNDVVADLAAERQLRIDENKERKKVEEKRQDDRKTDRRILWGALLTTFLALIGPLVIKGVGLS